MIYNKKNKKGFTLMELLVTVILVAILASYGVYYYNDIINEGKLNAAKGKLSALGGATARFVLENAGGALDCDKGYNVGNPMSEILESYNTPCMGEDVDHYYYMFDVFTCDYAEKSLSWDENFNFYFGCPSAFSCGSYNHMTVFMKPKDGVSGDYPGCAYFDPNFDKVMEVR